MLRRGSGVQNMPCDPANLRQYHDHHHRLPRNTHPAYDGGQQRQPNDVVWGKGAGEGQDYHLIHGLPRKERGIYCVFGWGGVLSL